MLDRARQVETAADDFTEASAALARDASGTVRITTQEIFANTLLAPMLRELHERIPRSSSSSIPSRNCSSSAMAQADIAIRSTNFGPPAGTVGRRLCVDDWTLYCSREYAALHGVPRTRDDLLKHAIIGGGGGKLWRHYEAWLRSLGLEKQVAMHHATSTGLLSGVRSGFGLAVLPCLVADADPDLIRCLPPRDAHGRDMWLLTHDRVRHTPRVRLTIDFLYERLMAHVRMLESQRAAA